MTVSTLLLIYIFPKQPSLVPPHSVLVVPLLLFLGHVLRSAILSNQSAEKIVSIQPITGDKSSSTSNHSNNPWRARNERQVLPSTAVPPLVVVSRAFCAVSGQPTSGVIRSTFNQSTALEWYITHFHQKFAFFFFFFVFQVFFRFLFFSSYPDVVEERPELVPDLVPRFIRHPGGRAVVGTDHPLPPPLCSAHKENKNKPKTKTKTKKTNTERNQNNNKNQFDKKEHVRTNKKQKQKRKETKQREKGSLSGNLVRGR